MATFPTLLPSFDPRHVPVTGVDDHLPVVPPERLTPLALRQRFQAPPHWQPEVRQEPLFVERAPVDAAVLVPLVLRAGGLSVLLTERALGLSSHSGQVAFPGGKVEASDGNVVHAALRETREEVGLTDGFIDVLGQLPVYATGSQFLVTPVVALVHEGFVLHPNADEVAHRRHRFEWAGGVREWFSMPYREPAHAVPGSGESAPATEHFIWGATAGMLRNFYRFLLA